MIDEQKSQEENHKSREESSQLVRATEDALAIVQSNINELFRTYKIGNPVAFDATVNNLIGTRDYLHKCIEEIPEKYPAIVKPSESGPEPHAKRP